MANTFFGFDASIDNGEHLLPPEGDDDDDCVENEEEYDALNDETFGGLEDTASLNDWEQQHEQYAEIAESTKHSEQLENSISQLMLDDEKNDEKLLLTQTAATAIKTNSSNNSVWSYTPSNKNGDIFNSSSILSNLQKASKSFLETRMDSKEKFFPQFSNILPQHMPKKICTVEELEKNLIKPKLPPPNLQQFRHPFFQQLPPQQQQQQQQQQPLPPGPLRYPPGFGMGPPGPPPPGPPGRPFPQMGQPPPPHLPPPGLMLPFGAPPPRLMYGPVPQAPFSFPAPPHLRPPPPLQSAQLRGYPLQQQPVGHHSPQQQHPLQHPQQHQQQRRIREVDDFAGLMTNKEKQWLLNIQMLQLNTGTPYFDDYYYTVFKERKSRVNKENLNFPSGMNNYQHKNRQDQQQQQQQQTLTPRVYTPLQFENSLGKLQCGSVTAPRKIIDMDIVAPENSSETTVTPIKDTKRTKQFLLELEVLYTFLLKAEDLKNPLAINNLEKLREIKQKQRLRELEMAPTPEQKQEILKLFKQESEPIVENQLDYIYKILHGLLQDDKLTHFLNIRKGKMLLLRLLPYLTADIFAQQLQEIWTKVLLSLPVVGRRDQAGDQILPKFYPYFKRYTQTITMSDILEIMNNLIETIKLDCNNRSTPLSHQGKSPLYFVLLNKFGVSALITLIIRTEFLLTTNQTTDKQQTDWWAFLIALADVINMTSNKIAPPIELIPQQIFTKHSMRFVGLNNEKKGLIEKYFVESSN